MGSDTATGRGTRLACRRCGKLGTDDVEVTELVCTNCGAPLRGKHRAKVETRVGDKVYYAGQPDLHFTVRGVYVIHDGHGFDSTWFVLEAPSGENHRQASHMVARV